MQHRFSPNFIIFCFVLMQFIDFDERRLSYRLRYTSCVYNKFSFLPLCSSITESFLLTKLMHWYWAEHPRSANATTATWLAVVFWARMRKQRSDVLVSTGAVSDDRYPTSITSPMSFVLYTWRPVTSRHRLPVVHAGNMHCGLGQPKTSAARPSHHEWTRK